MKSIITRIENLEKEHGDEAVSQILTELICNNTGEKLDEIRRKYPSQSRLLMKLIDSNPD